MYKILYHKRALGIFSYQKTHNVYTERGEEHIKTFRSRANKITHSTASTEFENERRHKKISNELAKNDKWLERLYFGIDGFLYFFVVCFAIEKSLVGYINMKWCQMWQTFFYVGGLGGKEERGLAFTSSLDWKCGQSYHSCRKCESNSNAIEERGEKTQSWPLMYVCCVGIHSVGSSIVKIREFNPGVELFVSKQLIIQSEYF